MWRLTQEQQALAAQYFYVAKATARRMERGRDPDRSMSASCYGLCYGVHKWIPDYGNKSLRNYLIWSCRQAIISEFRRDNRDKRNMRIEGKHYPYMAMTNAAPWDLERSYDQVQWSDDPTQQLKISQVLYKLAPQERLAMELTLSGMRQCEIEKMMKWGRHVAGAALYRGVAKIKKELA